MTNQERWDFYNKLALELFDSCPTNTHDKRQWLLDRDAVVRAIRAYDLNANLDKFYKVSDQGSL